jgi:hypothetical protein
MDQAIGIGHLVELEPVAAEGDGPIEAAGEETFIDRLGGIGSEDSESDARVTVVEAAADLLTVAVEDVHDAAAGDARGRFLDHLLEDPRVRGTPSDLEAHLRQDGGHVGSGHGSSIPPFAQ